MKYLLSILLVIAQVVWAADQPSQDAQQHMKAGLEAAQKRSFDIAATEFKEVTKLAPNSPTGFVRLGQVLMESGKFEEAKVPLLRATELDPTSVAAQKLLGYCLLAQGYASEAISHFEVANEYAGLGIAQIQIDKPSDAVTNLQRALSQRPNDPDLLFYLSRAAEMLSAQSADALMTLYPNSPRAHQMSGKTFFNMRQLPEAEKQYQQAIALRSGLPDVHLELGQIYAANSQWDKAEQEFRSEAERQPGNAEAAYRLGDALLHQVKSREAKIELERASNLRTDMPETLYALGKAAAQCGDETRAESAWQRVIELEKDSELAGQAHFNLAGLYRKQRKTEQVDREMQAFRRLQKTSITSEARAQNASPASSEIR